MKPNKNADQKEPKKRKNKTKKKSKVKEKHSAEKEFLSIIKGNVNIQAPILYLKQKIINLENLG